ncbi:monocarboxylate transporter 5-like [Haliotis rufescens]|uniref:monocarboxylate transporter 5-like n=1 Tax=Haliotis rufescens TaxID=6454 RepID=UPI00201E7B17|nr:monocarboxylate transporter 5-like [Haliotis rufescens]
MMASRKDIDQGYAWVALASAVSIQLLAGLVAFSSGVINIAIMQEVENDITKSSWIGSTLIGSYTILGPIAGMVQHRFGSKLTALSGGTLTLVGMTLASFCQTIVGLVITYGFMAGFGLCLGANVVGVIPGQYFEKKRPAAYGLCMVGGGMGLFVAGPLARFLLDEYKLHGTLLIIGAIAFNTCIAASLLRKPPLSIRTIVIEEHHENESVKNTHAMEEGAIRPRNLHPLCTEDGTNMMSSEHLENSYDDLTQTPFLQKADSSSTPVEKQASKQCCVYTTSCSMLKTTCNKSFLLYNTTIIFWSLGDAACIFHLPNYAEVMGSSPTAASNLLSALGAGGVFARFTIGLLASDSSIEFPMLQVGFVGITGLITALFPLMSNTYHWQIVFSFFYGVYSHGTNSLMGPFAIELTGLATVAVGFGVVYFSCGIGYLLGPVIASFIYEASGVYDYTFIFAGVCFLLSSISTAAITVCRKRREF